MNQMNTAEKPPLVSIILTTYNRAYILNRSIQSLLNQTYHDFELIVVDDGSLDNTEDLVKSITDIRIRYLRHDKNRGTSKARNTGLKAVRGEYIAFQDSDDEWMPEKLEKQIKAFESASAEVGVVYTDLLRVNSTGAIRYWHSPRVTSRNLINPDTNEYQVLQLIQGSVLIRKRCFDEVGFFDENFPRLIDMELLTRISQHYDFIHIQEPLYKYYATEGAITSNVTLLFKAEKLLMEKYGKALSGNKKFLAKQYFRMGLILCNTNQLRQGRSYLMKAVKMHPLKARYIGFALLSLLGQNVFNSINAMYRATPIRRKSADFIGNA